MSEETIKIELEIEKADIITILEKHVPLELLEGQSTEKLSELFEKILEKTYFEEVKQRERAKQAAEIEKAVELKFQSKKVFKKKKVKK